MRACVILNPRVSNHTTMRVFTIHYNGSRPFRVEIDDDTRTLRAFRSIHGDVGIAFGAQPVYEIVYEQVYIAHDAALGAAHDGFTILATTRGGQRMHAIIYDIREFDLLPGDHLVAYHANMGLNDVPYSWIEGTRACYSISEHVYVPLEWRDALQLGRAYDMHYQIYGMYAHRALTLGLSGELANRNVLKYVSAHFAIATDIMIGNGTQANSR